MTLVIGSLQLGFLYGILALGIYVTFRILNIPDLTAEGSFTLGLAASAVCTLAGHPVAGIVAAAVAGALAGCVTGVLQTKMGIHAVLAGILTMCGLYTINLIVMGSSPNISLINVPTVFKAAESLGLSKEAARLVIAIAAAAVCLVLLILFFRTHLGLCIRATGDNERVLHQCRRDENHGAGIQQCTGSGQRRSDCPVSGICGCKLRFRYAGRRSGIGHYWRSDCRKKRSGNRIFFLDFRFDHLPLYHRSGNQEPDFSGICVKTGISVHRSGGAGDSGDPLSDGTFKDEADERKRYV